MVNISDESCDTCKFCSISDIDKETLKKVLRCIKYPPTVIPIPTTNGIALSTSFPIVNDKMVCHEYVTVPRILN